MIIQDKEQKIWRNLDIFIFSKVSIDVLSINRIQSLLLSLETEFVCCIDHGLVEICKSFPEIKVDRILNGKRLDGLKHSELFKTYRRKRHLCLAKVKGVPVLVEDHYGLFDCLKRYIHKQAKKHPDRKRAVDLSKVNIEDIVKVIEQKNDKDNFSHDSQQPENKGERVFTGTKHEAPRPKQVTTKVASTDGFIEDKRGTVTPLFKIKCDKPLHAQATDGPESIDEASFAVGNTSFVSKLASIPGQLVPTSTSKYNPLADHHGSSIASGGSIGLPSAPARHPDYREYDSRLQSFSRDSWPKQNTPPAKMLAAWGFFFTGRNDLVRCFQCGIGMKDWQVDDDPMTEHVRHSSECQYLTLKLSSQELQRIKIAVKASNTDEKQDTVTAPPTNSLPFPIRTPKYQTMESRLASFASFPDQVKISHQKLAIAGLYYTGERDLCRCFTCDGGLQSWAPEDDPVEEHTKYFPNCSYIKHLKGEDYVRQVQEKVRRDQVARASALRTTYSNKNIDVQQSTFQEDKDIMRSKDVQTVLEMGFSQEVVKKAVKDLQERGQKHITAVEITNLVMEKYDHDEASADSTTDCLSLEEENERLKSLVRCRLCAYGECNTLFLPCGHHRVCEACSVSLETCPVCGRFISTKIRTFMA